jgi:hypothetical protein
MRQKVSDAVELAPSAPRDSRGVHQDPHAFPWWGSAQPEAGRARREDVGGEVLLGSIMQAKAGVEITHDFEIVEA